MGEKLVVVQDGVQKQLKGWGCPVVVGEQEEEEGEEEEEEEAAGRAVSCSWKRGGGFRQPGVGGWGNLHPERVWTTGHLSCFCVRSRKLTHETGSSPSF